MSRTSVKHCLGQREQTFQMYFLGITAVLLSPLIHTSSITKAISKADTVEDYIKKTYTGKHCKMNIEKLLKLTLICHECQLWEITEDYCDIVIIAAIMC